MINPIREAAAVAGGRPPCCHHSVGPVIHPDFRRDVGMASRIFAPRRSGPSSSGPAKATMLGASARRNLGAYELAVERSRPPTALRMCCRRVPTSGATSVLMWAVDTLLDRYDRAARSAAAAVGVEQGRRRLIASSSALHFNLLGSRVPPLQDHRPSPHAGNPVTVGVGPGRHLRRLQGFAQVGQLDGGGLPELTPVGRKCAGSRPGLRTRSMLITVVGLRTSQSVGSPEPVQFTCSGLVFRTGRSVSMDELDTSPSGALRCPSSDQHGARCGVLQLLRGAADQDGRGETAGSGGDHDQIGRQLLGHLDDLRGGRTAAQTSADGGAPTFELGHQRGGGSARFGLEAEVDGVRRRSRGRFGGTARCRTAPRPAG